MVDVKICGLRTAQDAAIAAKHGADFLGFIHFARSPRHVSLETAAKLGEMLPAGPARVGVLVDADLNTVRQLIDLLSLDYLQLHGPHTPAEIDAIRDVTGLKIIKAIAVGNERDLMQAEAFAGVADKILFDAKPPAGADRPGGNAIQFDWSIMQGYKRPLDWLLAGGLRPDNVQEAIRQTRAPGVDVASGVETEPGIKSHQMIKDFLQLAKSAS